MANMTDAEKIEAIEGVMEGATTIGTLLVASGQSEALADVAKAAMTVIEEILSGEFNPREEPSASDELF